MILLTTVKDERTGQVGRLTGGARHCQLEGCLGRRLGVRWPDGELTWPCTKGMVQEGNQWLIPKQ